MLTVRIQVIDGTGTFTLSDSQPCRLLTSLHRHYPASAVLRTSPPPRGARPVPHGLPVGHRRPRLGASRVSCAFLVYMLPPLPRRSSWAYASLTSPSRVSLPRKGRRVGLRIVLFEACSAFTRVAACTLALSPIRDTHSEGFSHFVASMTAPVASGWSGCRMGFAPTGKRRLVTAHTQLGHPRVRPKMERARLSLLTARRRSRSETGTQPLGRLSQYYCEPVALVMASINRSDGNGLSKNATQPRSMACCRCRSSRDPVMNMIGNVNPFAESWRPNSTPDMSPS